MNLYFDNAATTQPSQLAIDVFDGVSRNTWGNPSSTMYETGIAARRLLHEARDIVADTLLCEPDQIIFTSGSTEGANMIMKGFIPRGYEATSKILLTKLEHPVVYNTAVYLQSCGAGLSFIKNTRWGTINIDSLEEELERAKDFRRVIVCLTRVNNELGSRLLPYISAYFSNHTNTKLMVDLTQAISSPEPLNAYNADYAFASAHKFGGLKGVGFVYAKDPKTLVPLLHGGHQESGYRAGTENVAAIYSMARQLEDYRRGVESSAETMIALHSYLCGALTAIGGRINGDRKNGVKNIVSATFDGFDAKKIIALLDMKYHISLSAGSACSTGSNEYSRVLKACDFTEDEMLGTLRISLTSEHTTEDIDCLVSAIKEILNDKNR